MMYDFLIYALKASACTGVFFVFYKLLLARETFHRINRILLLVGMIASFLLPLLVLTVTKELPFAPVVDDIVITTSSEVTNETVINHMLVENILGLFYIVGIVAMFVRIVLSIHNVMKIVRKGSRITLADNSVLVTLDANIGAFSWLRYIVVSKFEDPIARRMIIMHEQGHIRMHHTVDLLLLDVIGALQWFNPFMWMLRAELKNIHEFEADSYVLSRGADAKEYQLLLIKKAVGASRYSVANSFNHNTLKIRITMMLNKKSSKLARAKALLVLPLLCMGVMAFAETDYVYAVDKGSEKSVEITKNDSLKVLYVVDGRKTASIDGINAADIAETTVLKDSDAAAYGSYDQVVTITTKKKVKDITINGTVKDENGLEVLGAVVKVWKGEEETVTDRLGKFTLKAKNTDIISVSFTGYRTVNMKAKENMAFVLKYKTNDSTSLSSAVGVLTTSTNAIRNNLQKELEDLNGEIEASRNTSTSTSTSTTTSNTGDGVNVMTNVRITKDNGDGTTDVSTSFCSTKGSDKIEIEDNGKDAPSFKSNGKNMIDPIIIVDGRKIKSINDINSSAIKSITVNKKENTIFITLKKDTKHTITSHQNVTKEIPGEGKKYYVTTHDGTMEIILAKNAKEAIKYCEKHYKENVLLTKRPNGGFIEVVKPKK